MIKVTLSGIDEQLASLSRLEQDQLPFATALALTRTAEVVRDDLRAEMQVVFDRPTPATLNSLFIEPATKQKLEARVWINDGRMSKWRTQQIRDEKAQSSKWREDRTAIKWLTPEVFGGPRNDKGVEALLRRRGVLTQGQYVMPGEKLPLDQYGNINRGKLTQILSGARLFEQAGFDANATNSKRSQAKGHGRRFFMMYDANRKPFAIAERTGKGRAGLKIVLAFTKRPSYSKRLDWFEIAERSAEAALPREFEKALAHAMATRRGR